MEFAFECVRTVREEEPDLFDDVMQQQVYDMLEEAIECEVQFAEDVLSGGVAGISTRDMRQYLQHCADQHFAKLGMPKRYDVRNPLPFMELQDVQELTNFFERRASAYQVGVLAAIAELRRARGLQHGPNPFPVLAGTSAGAINVAALACHADAFDSAVRRMLHVWGHMHTEQIYKADSLSVLRSGARWLTLLSLGWALARWSRMRPRSLLDNAPLKALMNSGLMPFERIPQLIDSGHLHALAITASSYSSGQHITFFQTREALSPWVRDQRKAVQTLLSADHLLASSALPFIFPAMPLN